MGAIKALGGCKNDCVETEEDEEEEEEGKEGNMAFGSKCRILRRFRNPM